MGCVIDPS
jgi:hypothetical protein